MNIRKAIKVIAKNKQSGYVVFGFQFGEKQKSKEFLDNFFELFDAIPFDKGVTMGWESEGAFIL